MIEDILKAACKAHGLTAIGANLFSPDRGNITVYVHFGDGYCEGATSTSFEGALKAALDEKAKTLARVSAA